MIAEKTSDYPQHPHRHLCATGRRLHQEWLDAMTTGVKEVIGPTIQAYFLHINGVCTVKYNGKMRRSKEPCFECGPYKTETK
jgi:hypothetical protein